MQQKLLASDERVEGAKSGERFEVQRKSFILKAEKTAEQNENALQTAIWQARNYRLPSGLRSKK